MQYTNPYMQPQRLMSWARSVYLAGIALSILFIIPSVWFPLQLGKVALFAVFLAASFTLFVLSGGVRDFLHSRGSRAALLVAGLPLVYLVSWYFSVDRSVGVVGYMFDTDTVVFVVLSTLAFLLAFALYTTARAARALMYTVASSILASVLFQYTVMLFGTNVVPFAVFADRSVNLIGKWNDLGLLAGMLLVLVLFVLEFVSLSAVRRILLGALALVLVLLLAVVQFPLVWGMVLCVCVALALWSFFSKQTTDAAEWTLADVPWMPLLGAGVSILLLLYGASVNTRLTNILPVSSLEVRPAFSSTLDITRLSHGTSIERFLVGTGPQTFGQSWLLHKPLEVNQSPFWSLDFAVGFSTFATALASVGIIGVLVWCVPFVLVVFGLLRALRSPAVTEKVLVLSLGVSSMLLWVGMLLYVPSQSSILLAFVLSGAAFGFCMKNRTPTERAHVSRLGQLLFAFVSLAVIALAWWIAVLVVRQAVAQVYVNKGAAELSKGDIDKALAFAAKAQNIKLIQDSVRLTTAARGANLQKIAAIQSPSVAEQELFRSEVEKVIPDGLEVLALAPNDYRGYVALGRIYSLLASVGVSGAAESAEKMYQQAALLHPTSPEIPLALARLEAVRGGGVAAIETHLSRSLTLKADYTDAILFLVQLNVANKDIPNAIRAAQAAVRSAPGVPAIWFELGLLHYSANDMANATAVFEQAVKLQPEFANAKYFLGLSYAAVGRTAEALQQFVDLEKTNPDNQEVKLILDNLRAGKPPFENAQPPVTDAPQERTTAPIAQ